MAAKRTDRSWDTGTWAGARREQFRRWRRLTLREKLKAVEDMGVLAGHFAKRRRERKAGARAT
ncbi:MAG TPA: hypothetical protein VMB80_02335 [Candidatus Acidoferrum sp.]|nr:hypothetical protein [Candidatus Acidoferrum sp.]